MRLAIDTGGTFTDLVVEEGETRRLYKSSSTPSIQSIWRVGRLACMTIKAKRVPRAHEDSSYIFIGNQLGRSVISTGIEGVASHETWFIAAR